MTSVHSESVPLGEVHHMYMEEWYIHSHRATFLTHLRWPSMCRNKYIKYIHTSILVMIRFYQYPSYLLHI